MLSLLSTAPNQIFFAASNACLGNVTDEQFNAFLIAVKKAIKSKFPIAQVKCQPFSHPMMHLVRSNMKNIDQDYLQRLILDVQKSESWK